MRILLLSDIHADAAGLREVLGDAARYGWDEAVLLGDIVGYGSEPLETLQLLADLNVRASIQGNHEFMLGELRAQRKLAAAGHVVESLQLCLDTLSEDQLDALVRLPAGHADHAWQAVHGSLRRQFAYMLTPADARENEPDMTRDLVLCGHTHVPVAFVSDGPGRFKQRSALLPETHFGLPPGERAFINPGSASHNRDRQGGRSYAIIDERTRDVFLRRLS